MSSSLRSYFSQNKTYAKYTPSTQAANRPNETGTKLINTIQHHELTKESDQPRQINERPPSKLNPFARNREAAMDRVWVKRGERKREAVTIVHDRSFSKRTRNMKQIDASVDDSDEENVEHPLQQEASSISNTSLDLIYRTKPTSTQEASENTSIKSYGLNPLSESNRSDDFDMILSTPTYEHGKPIQNARANFSYRTSASYSSRSTMNSVNYMSTSSDSD